MAAERRPAVEGVFEAAVKGDDLLLSIGCRAGKVMIGGNDVAGFSEPSKGFSVGCCRLESSPAGDLGFCDLFGVCVFELPKVKALAPPRLIRREKLFDLVCGVDPLLDVVDCDQRLRFPMPSCTPLKLFERLCEAL